MASADSSSLAAARESTPDSPAVPPPAPTPAGAPAAPTLGPLLGLSPAHYERQYRACPQARESLVQQDKWATAFLLAFNALYLAYMWQFNIWAPVVMAVLLCLVLVSSSLGHFLWILWRPASYASMRLQVVLVHRLARILVAASLTAGAAKALDVSHPLNCADCVSGAGCWHINSSAPVFGQAVGLAQNLPAALGTLRVAAVVSGGYVAVVFAVALPLPVVQQACIQLLHLMLVLALGMRPYVQLLQLLTQPEDVATVCHGMNLVLESVSVGLLGTSPGGPGLSRRCEQRAHATIVLFTLLYLVVMVPIYVAYHVEKHHKSAFIVRTASNRRAADATEGARLPAAREDIPNTADAAPGAVQAAAEVVPGSAALADSGAASNDTTVSEIALGHDGTFPAAGLANSADEGQVPAPIGEGNNGNNGAYRNDGGDEPEHHVQRGRRGLVQSGRHVLGLFMMAVQAWVLALKFAKFLRVPALPHNTTCALDQD